MSGRGTGERICVAGSLQTSEYTDGESQKRTSAKVVVLRSASVGKTPEWPREAQ